MWLRRDMRPTRCRKLEGNDDFFGVVFTLCNPPGDKASVLLGKPSSRISMSFIYVCCQGQIMN
jgi:hypothetical protein